jgi:hypothetical protein
MPALALIYCGIDIVANLSRPENQPEVTRSDFVKWAEHYMKCESRLGVSGLDLYGARCGILHAYGMDSRLSGAGSARRIMYAWGNRSVEAPKRLLQSLGFSEAVVKIEDLSSVYAEGVANFSAKLAQDVDLADIVQQRARKLFMEQSSFP